jgi:hypothetical protein
MGIMRSFLTALQLAFLGFLDRYGHRQAQRRSTHIWHALAFRHDGGLEPGRKLQLSTGLLL